MIMGSELDGKIRMDANKLISSYRTFKNLPPVMSSYFEKLNAPIVAENKKIKERNDKLPAGATKEKYKPMNTICVFQVSWALNAVGGDHAVPESSHRRRNTQLSGGYHMGAVDELEIYLTAKYGRPEIVETPQRQTQAKMEAYMAGRPGIIAFRQGWAGEHTEIWNGKRILQNGAPIPNNTSGVAVMDAGYIFGRENVYFWEIVPPSKVSLSAPWLSGWWTVSDVPLPYYYYFYPDGTVVYTRTEPRSNICPVARPEYTGSWNLVAPVGIRIKWAVESYPVEVLYYPPASSITMMAGTYEAKAMPPFVATKKIFYR